MTLVTSALSLLLKNPSFSIRMSLPAQKIHTSISRSVKSKASVVLVGCGAPNRGMGWYHAIQLINNQCPSAKLDYIIEPWFLGPGKESTEGKEFLKCQSEWEKKYSITFLKSLDELPCDNYQKNISSPRLTLLSGRTADNPKLFEEAIRAGSQGIYLEKPGAPSVKELQFMMEQAKKSDVKVFMGYNKNVSKYVQKTIEFAKCLPNSRVTFVSNNAYENTHGSLGECFERNCEGMLKNMAIHELALLVCFYDAKVQNIQCVEVNEELSSLQTLLGPSGKKFTDFDKIHFTLKMKDGTEVSVQADRCGGTDSFGIIEVDGQEVQRYIMPDVDDQKLVQELKMRYPMAMPYFFTQDSDYQVLKEKVAKNLLEGGKVDGIATIEEAIDTLKVAEYLTEILKQKLN